MAGLRRENWRYRNTIEYNDFRKVDKIMEKELKNPNKELEEQETQELDLGALEQVTGGSLKDVVYTPTVDISEDTKSKI